RLEVMERLRIGEDDPAEARSVERPVVPAQVGSEPGDDRIECRLTRLHDLARELVGVDDDDARSFTEPARDRRLAAADGSGQPDPERPGAGRRLALMHRPGVYGPAWRPGPGPSPSWRSTSCCRTMSCPTSCCPTTSCRT